MKIEEDKLYNDFQGWPVYKMTVKEILSKLGFERIEENGVFYWRIKEDESTMNNYPVIYHDDSMGYSPTTEYITESYIDPTDSSIILWADKKIEKE